MQYLLLDRVIKPPRDRYLMPHLDIWVHKNNEKHNPPVLFLKKFYLASLNSDFSKLYNNFPVPLQVSHKQYRYMILDE